MSQMNENDTSRSRFERIEALTLEIAAANLRHDRSLERLNQASVRHDEEYQEIRATLSQVSERLNQVSEQQKQSDEEFGRIRATLNEVSEQQRSNQEQIAQLSATSLRHAEEMSQINATLREVSEQQRANQHQIALNQEQLNQFTAGLIELRHLVANYIQSRSNLQSEE